VKTARKRSAARKTGVRSTTQAVRSGRKTSGKSDSVGAGAGSFPRNAAGAGFDKGADRCIALIDDSRKRGTNAAYAYAIATILDNASAITERPVWTLGDSELLAFGKRLRKLQFASYLDRLRNLLMQRGWGDAYYVALQALRQAGLA
jgi:hypothetical protein